MGQHSIAELFAALTRLPVQPRIHPVEAARIVTENILPYFEVVSLGKEDYLEALNTMASGGWSGAKIYDALLLRCGTRCAVAALDRSAPFTRTRFGGSALRSPADVSEQRPMRWPNPRLEGWGRH
jgi:hypothetical protein